MDKKLLKNKGVTLITLVITIIVLVIIAGVSISALVNNGIIGRANEAKRLSEIATIKEQIQMALLNKSMKQNTNVTVQDLLDELLEENIIDSADIISKEPENDPTEAWIQIDGYKFRLYMEDENEDIIVQYEDEVRTRTKCNYKNKHSAIYKKFYNFKYN